MEKSQADRSSVDPRAYGFGASLQPPTVEPPADYLGYHTSVLVNVVSKGLAEALEPFRVAPIEFAVLHWCSRGEAATVTSLARVSLMDAARMSRVVSVLVDRGLLQRRRQRSDRRTVQLALTEEGKALLPELDRCVQGYYSVLLEGVSDEEKRGFAATTRKILTNSTHRAAPQGC